MLIDSMANQSKLTPARQRKFLDVLSETGSAAKGALAVKISRNTLYIHRKKNKKFAEAWEEAEQRGVDALVEEARRRAYDGVNEPVFYKGEEVGLICKYSDTLLMFLIKAKRPEYRENYQMNLTGDLTVNIKKFTDGRNTTK